MSSPIDDKRGIFDTKNMTPLFLPTLKKWGRNLLATSEKLCFSKFKSLQILCNSWQDIFGLFSKKFQLNNCPIWTLCESGSTHFEN